MATSGHDAVPAIGEDEAAELQRQRANHIRRNMEMMARMGLLDAAKDLRPEKETAEAPKKRVKKERAEPAGDREMRRSARLQGAQAEMPDGIDMYESSDDDENPRPARVRGAPVVSRDILEDAREWLAQTRKALLELPAPSPGSGECRWKAEAARRWGDKVTCSTGDWETFVRSRLSTPPPPSPLQLMQEFYAVDPWQLLCACVLMSRVSSWATKHNTISAFFERFPTPSSFLDANPEEVQVLLHPLGLFPNRMQSLVAITGRFLEAPLFNVGLEPELKIYGVGQFGVDSYRLFCRGDLKCNPEDRNLKAFAEWQKKNAAKGGGGTAKTPVKGEEKPEAAEPAGAKNAAGNEEGTPAGEGKKNKGGKKGGPSAASPSSKDAAPAAAAGLTTKKRGRRG